MSSFWTICLQADKGSRKKPLYTFATLQVPTVQNNQYYQSDICGGQNVLNSQSHVLEQCILPHFNYKYCFLLWGLEAQKLKSPQTLTGSSGLHLVYGILGKSHVLGLLWAFSTFCDPQGVSLLLHIPVPSTLRRKKSFPVKKKIYIYILLMLNVEDFLFNLKVPLVDDKLLYYR